MQKISYFLTIAVVCSLAACSSNGSEGGGSTSTSSKGFTQTPSGLSYNIHTKNAGEKAKFGNFSICFLDTLQRNLIPFFMKSEDCLHNMNHTLVRDNNRIIRPFKHNIDSTG